MPEIKTFPFDRFGVEDIRASKYGVNWPIVYILENGKELYVGESMHAYSRSRQHLDNTKRRLLNRIHVISDDEYNKSATLDTESSLIEYLVADGDFEIQNSNKGLRNHEYYDREKYQAKFEELWKKLQVKQIARQDLLQIRNSDIFKYSPYKTLSEDQHLVATEIMDELVKDEKQVHLIHGGPGTGKTILATYLIKRLVEEGQKEIALVIAMSSLRKTLRKVFRSIPGLTPAIVIGPNDVTKKKYDILVVDEAHRLRRRKNLTGYGSFDETNRKLGLDNDGTELDWVLASAKQTILFFDERQTVRPSDIPLTKVQSAHSHEFHLKKQIRVKGGEEYIQFIDDLLEVTDNTTPQFNDYDFKLYSDASQMVRDIKALNNKHHLCRVVAGYAWKWISRTAPDTPDIAIGDTKLFWNSVTSDWVNSPNAINEVGCIHTIQGYDLNYAGVIIGPEISFDPKKNEITIDRNRYFDANGHRGVKDDSEIKRYIINIYKTLLTRGILGTYVYVCDDNLRNYLNSRLTKAL